MPLRCFLLFPIVSAFSNFSGVDASKDYSAEMYTHDILTSLPKNSLVLSYQWDTFVAASLYYQNVDHVRKDIIIIDKELLRRSWYASQVHNRYAFIFPANDPAYNDYQENLQLFENDLPYDPNVIERSYSNFIREIISGAMKNGREVFVGPELEDQYLYGFNKAPYGLLFELKTDTNYVPFSDTGLNGFSAAKKVDNDYSHQIINFYSRMFQARAAYEYSHKYLTLTSFWLNKALAVDPLSQVIQTEKLQVLQQFSRLKQAALADPFGKGQMMFLSLLEIIAALYLAELTLYSYAAFRSRQIRNPRSNVSPQPKVSIVVAAKDEEKKLPACLDSLLKLAYPRDLLEIIIVNDQSNDSTPSIIDDASKNFIGVKRVDAIESSMLRGKANALSQGIDKATGEFIFLTDADCIVPPSWITETLKYFDENTGIVGGVTLISQTDKSIYGIQAIDWSFLLTIGAGAATLGKPVACLGNNLVFRKKAYDEIGGYRKIKFSVTEDFALFKAVASSGKWTYTLPDGQAHARRNSSSRIAERSFSATKALGNRRERHGTVRLPHACSGISVSLAYHFISVFLRARLCHLLFSEAAHGFIVRLSDSATLRKNCSLEIYALF